MPISNVYNIAKNVRIIKQYMSNVLNGGSTYYTKSLYCFNNTYLKSLNHIVIFSNFPTICTPSL